MKNLKIIILLVVIHLTSNFFSVNSQTIVSGGIYSNTTWTLANSPYIVVDTVVVFPNITLTIQPGVIIKFNSKMILEIRQANFIAIGTITDSITFTSNYTPTSLDSTWIINLNDASSSNFNYCNFKNATTAILCNISYSASSVLNFKNSNFNYNLSGIYLHSSNYSSPFIDSCIFRNNIYAINVHGYVNINHCNISNNQDGIKMGYSILQNSLIDSNDEGVYLSTYNTVNNCEITNNNIGLRNVTSLNTNTVTKNVIENNYNGIVLYNSGINIYCNKICNNTSYDLKSTIISNINVANNYWCTNDYATISSHIYDGYDNINLGLVNFMPFDTSQCYLITNMPVNAFENFLFNIFPNPSSNYLTLELPANDLKKEIKIYNLLGELEYYSSTFTYIIDIEILKLENGLHFIELKTGKIIYMQKFLKQ